MYFRLTSADSEGRHIMKFRKTYKRKQAAVLLSVFLLVTSVAGCQRVGAVKETGEEKVNVVTTIFPQYDFVRQIAGDNVEVSMLLKPGEETHSYEPTPQDILKIQNCDLFIYVGGENDEWVEDILDSIETHETLTPDEHVWTSPENAIAIVEQIADVLGELDPEQTAVYEENEKAYVSLLEELDDEFREVVSSAKRDVLLFGDRFPFRYFADEYGLKYYAAFPGCASDTEPSAATMAFLINKAKEEQIPVILKMELSNENIANAIAETTHAKVKTFYSCHNLTAKEFADGETYLSMMKKNVETLKEALN